jgi:colanic acid/amylovoran biosynthesis glycosyltransferase
MTIRPTTQRVLIFRDHLMLPSETFILAQAEKLQRYQPWYLCSKLFAPIGSPERAIVLNSSDRITLAEVAFKALGWAPGLRKKVGEIHPALVHAHFGTDGMRILPVSEALELPLIVTYHGFDATASDDALLRAFPAARNYAKNRDKLKAGANCFVAVSRFIASKLVQQGFAQEKIRQLYIGIDLNFFAPDPTVMRKNIVLFVGRLVGVKGCEDLITAMAGVQEVIPDAELAVIGDGPLRDHLQDMARQKLRTHRFLGTQSPAVVREWMNKAKVVSVPSKRDITGAEEGFGMVFAEAQAMGTPVVSYASGGIPEAVRHGVTGLLAPEGDHKSLAENIIRLLQDENIRIKFAIAGREHVWSNFDIRKQSAKLEETYDEVVRSHAERSSAYQSTREVNTCA